MVGTDGKMSCCVDPDVGVRDTKPERSHSYFSETVWAYQDGMEQAGGKPGNFEGRPELGKGYRSEGLRGEQMCNRFFRERDDSEDAIVELR